MSLPNIISAPIHTLQLQVLNKKITFSPFIVAQEKGFITAISDNNTEDIIKCALQSALKR